MPAPRFDSEEEPPTLSSAGRTRVAVTTPLRHITAFAVVVAFAVLVVLDPLGDLQRPKR